MITITAIVIILLLGLWGFVHWYLKKRGQYLDPENNFRRHAYDLYHYGHFSKIMKYNRFFIPEIFLCNEYRFTLNEGDTLYIPPGHWHWIKSDPNTFAVNSWSIDKPNTVKGNVPYVIRDFVKLSDHINVDVELNDNLVAWKSDEDLPYPIQSLNYNEQNYDNIYFVTLSNVNMGRHNRSFFKKYYNQKVINIMGSKDINFWLSSGKHDTGLHYDDNHGVIQVLKGKKEIIIFDKASSKYLHPQPRVPKWVSQDTTVFVESNTYMHFQLEKPYRNPSWLLYEMFRHHAKNDRFDKSVTEMTEKIYRAINGKKLVWGVKKMADGNYRYEYYFYHMPETIPVLKHNPLFHELCCEFTNTKERINLSTMLINSFDFEPWGQLHGIMHTYHLITPGEISMPHVMFGGSSYEDKVSKESQIYMDLYANFNYHDAMRRTGCNYDPRIFQAYSKDYPGKFVVFAKKKDYVLLQFLSISNADFLKFLIKYKFPASLIKSWDSHQDEFMMSNDIGIKINNKGQVVGASFYGVL